MRVLFFDLETTGVKVETDRIVEIAAVVQDVDSGRELMRLERKINPGMNIPAKTTAIHGIGNADVLGCPSFIQVAPGLAKLLASVDFVAGHNIRGYDCVLLLHEFIRVGVTVPRFPEIIDTVDARWATPDGKMPTLGELAWSLGIPYDKAKAHRALYDVEVNAQAWREGVRLGHFTIPTIAEKEAA